MREHGNICIKINGKKKGVLNMSGKKEMSQQKKLDLRRKKLHKLRVNGELFLLCLPALVGYLLFNYIPMIGNVLAFKDYKYKDGLFGSAWAGLKNFRILVVSDGLKKVIGNTVLYGVGWLILGIVLHVIGALLLGEITNQKSIKIFQTCMTIPNFMSIIIIGFITYAIFHPSMGFMNQVLKFFGKETVDVYTKPGVWPFILTFVTSWRGMGMGTLMYYAALMGIDPSLYDAAAIDGANHWQQSWYIAIPHLIGVVCVYGILGIGDILSADFGLFYQIPRNVVALYPTTDVMSTYQFRALQGATYGIGSAMGFVQSVSRLILVVTANLVVKKISPENSLF